MGQKAHQAELHHLSLPQTRSDWRLTANRVMLRPWKYAQVNLVGSHRAVPIKSFAAGGAFSRRSSAAMIFLFSPGNMNDSSGRVCLSWALTR